MKSLTKRGWILAGSALSTLVAGVFEKGTLLQLGFAVLFGSTAHAGPQSVPRAYQAYLPGCKDFLAGRSNFLSGRCVGAVEVLDDLGSGIKLFCPPEATNNLDRVGVIAAYIEARPERLKDGFGLMANEAMAKAWPCK
jgi:hypothetical protein